MILILKYVFQVVDMSISIEFSTSFIVIIMALLFSFNSIILLRDFAIESIEHIRKSIIIEGFLISEVYRGNIYSEISNSTISIQYLDCTFKILILRVNYVINNCNFYNVNFHSSFFVNLNDALYFIGVFECDLDG